MNTQPKEIDMNVKQLKEFLNGYPDDVEVIFAAYSDYQNLKKSDFSLVRAVQESSYVRRGHPIMSKRDFKKARIMLAIGAD